MEQNLIDDLVIESIKIFGVDCYYIPKYRIPTGSKNLQPALLQVLVDDPSETIFQINIVAIGQGYLDTPQITISAPESGTQATAVAEITRGVLTNVVITNAGSGYSSTTPPTITIESATEVAQRLGIPTITGGGFDDLLNEDDLPLYKEAFEVEMYVKNVDGFEGEGDFLSKFGLQIRDSMTLTVAIRSWEQEVGTRVEDLPARPFEGDLIYFPLNKKIFEIMHVEHEAIFYQMGSLQTYDLRCELFEYSNERFETGVEDIDSIFEGRMTTSTEAVSNAQVLETIDVSADNWVIEQEGDNILDFTADNPFGENNF